MKPMGPNTPRNLALTLLNRISPRSPLASDLLEEVFRRNPQLDARDRAFISNLVQGVLRWRLRLDWIIEQFATLPLKKFNPPVLNILRLALYQVYFLDRVPDSAAVNEAVKQAKQANPPRVVSFVNGILRNITRQKDRLEFPDRKRNPLAHLSVFYSFPKWLVEMWIRDWGLRFTESMLSAGNRIPSLNIRANPLKVHRTELIERLSREGVSGRPALYSPQGVLLAPFRGRIDGLSGFKEGLFQVQDQGAQIATHLLGPRPGETILDVCAGFGGKTTHLAELMGDRGEVIALDISRRRLLSLGDNARRLGIQSIRTVAADALKPLSSLFRKKFDRILVDAPCSGLGVISRHPDGKWNRNEADLRRLARMQEKMLHQAAPLLPGGGKLLYLTCTVSSAENEGVVENFLKEDQTMALENIKDHIPEWGLDLVDELGFFRTFPHLHDMDGFFGALFTKK